MMAAAPYLHGNQMRVVRGDGSNKETGFPTIPFLWRTASSEFLCRGEHINGW